MYNNEFSKPHRRPSLLRAGLAPLRLLIVWHANARARRDCAAMLSMSDETLRDIGLSRHDIVEALEEDRRRRWSHA